MGGFRLDADGCGTLVELLDDPVSGVSLSRRGGRALDRGQLLDPAKSLFAQVLGHDGNLPAGSLHRTLPRQCWSRATPDRTVGLESNCAGAAAERRSED